MAKVLTWGNTAFHPIESATHHISPKYVKVIYGAVFPNDIYTKDEVMALTNNEAIEEDVCYIIK